MKQDNNGQWQPTDQGDADLRYAGANKLIDAYAALLKVMSSGETMPIFPPFGMASALTVADTALTEAGEPYRVALLPDSLRSYAAVRKNVKQLLEIFDDDNSMRVFSDYGIQKSLAEALAEAKAKLQGPGGPSQAECDALSIPPARATDMHYVLAPQGTTIAAGDLVAGFVVDEWTDFIPDPSETTAVTFHFETPKAQAPQVILVAVPPVPGRPAGWQETGILAVIAETLDLMVLRSMANEEATGTSLGYFLPALVFDGKCDFGTAYRETYDGVVPGGFYYE
jgi:hypothetical protein